MIRIKSILSYVRGEESPILSSKNMSQFQYITKIELHDLPPSQTHPFMKLVAEEGSETVSIQNTLFPKEEDANFVFGIANVSIAPTPPIQLPIAILFSLDKSHSMSLSGGKAEEQPKMFYLKETMKNLLRVFANKAECEIWVAIDVFNNAVIHVQEFSRVTPETVDGMIERSLQYLEPDGSTNISDAIKSATRQIAQYKAAHPTHKMVHIQLSDGEATVGDTDKTSLASMVSEEYPNIFIGFGEKHDAVMLQCLSGKKYGEYRFIDKVENTGLVCGEIAHHLLYGAVREAEIRIENGQIYDWKTNEWTKTLLVGELAGDTERTFHVRTETPRHIIGEFWGIPAMSRDIEEAIQELEAVCLDIMFPPALRPVLLDTVRPLPYGLDKCRDGNPVETENAYIDLTRYMFRQRTQELLYETQAYNKTVDYFGFGSGCDKPIQEMKRMKVALRSHFDAIKAYLNENRDVLTTDDRTFLKVLQDDIYIAHQTMGDANAVMFCRSRQQSQGNQTAYAVNNIERRQFSQMSAATMSDLSATPRHRSRSSPGPAHLAMPSLARASSISLPDDDDNFSIFDASTVLYGCFGGVGDEDDETRTFSGHTLSQNTDTTYSTPSVVRMMRDVSVTPS